jgi:hypothetical protein
MRLNGIVQPASMDPAKKLLGALTNGNVSRWLWLPVVEYRCRA